MNTKQIKWSLEKSISLIKYAAINYPLSEQQWEVIKEQVEDYIKESKNNPEFKQAMIKTIDLIGFFDEVSNT